MNRKYMYKSVYGSLTNSYLVIYLRAAGLDGRINKLMTCCHQLKTARFYNNTDMTATSIKCFIANR